MTIQRLITTGLFVLALAAIVYGAVARARNDADHGPSKEVLAVVLPQAERFAQCEPSAAICPGYQGDTEMGAVIVSDRVAPEIRGYGGQISLAVGLDRAGVIRGLRLLQHSETPAYMAAILSDDYLSRFVGRSVATDMSDVQAVSGATVTSQAIRTSVLLSARRVAAERYGIELQALPSESGEGSTALDWTLFSLAALLGLAAVAIRNTHLRLLSGLVSIAVFGVWLNVAAAFPQLVDLLSGRLPVGARLEPLMLLGLALVFAAPGKHVYCRQLCPFGALQDIVYRLVPLRLSPGTRVLKALKLLRWVFLTTLIVSVFGLGIASAAQVEPFGILFSLTSSASLIGFALAALLSGALLRRFWCRFLCPTGACLDLIGRGGHAVRARFERGKRSAPFSEAITDDEA